MASDLGLSLGILLAAVIPLPYVLGWCLSPLFARESVDRLFRTSGSPVRLVSGVLLFLLVESVFHASDALRSWREPGDPLFRLAGMIVELFRQGRTNAAGVLLCYGGAEVIVCLLLSRLSLRLLALGVARATPFRRPLG